MSSILRFATRLGARLLPLLALLAGCLGDLPSKPAGGDPTPAPSAPAGKGDAVAPALLLPSSSESPDAGTAPTATPDLGKPASDLLGLVDCFGYATCDPTAMICIKYMNGTTGNPTGFRNAPSCYGPADPCAGGNYNCACIQADPSLSMYCGTCIDNQDRTFTCSAL